jgi:hypothetical protein
MGPGRAVLLASLHVLWGRSKHFQVTVCKSLCIHVSHFVWVEVCVSRNVLIELMANKAGTGTVERRELLQLVILCRRDCDRGGGGDGHFQTGDRERGIHAESWLGNLDGEVKSFGRR